MEIDAPSRWSRVDFISDLHLSPLEEGTFQLFKQYLASTTAEALFILGDLFEVWVGDDVLSSPDCFESRCASLLREASSRIDIFLMCGNRDFLMGDGVLQAAHATLLDDPCVLAVGDQRILMTHGDALCLEDTDYQAFRKTVRSPEWRGNFLGKPLSERLSYARGLRDQSESRKKSGVYYPDVDHGAACELMHQTHADFMIHGHTHRPAVHTLSNSKLRWVLSDWDANARIPRADVISCSRLGNTVDVVRRQILPP